MIMIINDYDYDYDVIDNYYYVVVVFFHFLKNIIESIISRFRWRIAS